MEIKVEKEWVYLMMQAKELGIPIGEIRRFLQQGSIEEIPHLENKSEISLKSNFDTIEHNGEVY